jgi:hypothetical protein
MLSMLVIRLRGFRLLFTGWDWSFEEAWEKISPTLRKSKVDP